MAKTALLLAAIGDPVMAIVAHEDARGFNVVRPGDEPWFSVEDWRPASVASIDGRRVRLVLLHAHVNGQGALTRTLAAIKLAGFTPSIIEPTRELKATLARRGWIAYTHGSTFDDQETIWVEAAVKAGE